MIHGSTRAVSDHFRAPKPVINTQHTREVDASQLRPGHIPLRQRIVREVQRYRHRGGENAGPKVCAAAQRHPGKMHRDLARSEDDVDGRETFAEVSAGAPERLGRRG